MDEIRNNITKDVTELANKYELEIWVLNNPKPGIAKYAFCNPYTGESETLSIELKEVLDSFNNGHDYQEFIDAIANFLLTHLFNCDIVD